MASEYASWNRSGTVSVVPGSKTENVNSNELPDVLYFPERVREFLNTHYSTNTDVSISDFACVTESLSLDGEFIMNMSLSMVVMGKDTAVPEPTPTPDPQWDEEKGVLILPVSYLYQTAPNDTNGDTLQFVDQIHINDTPIDIRIG